jgi:hypothetical protein
MVFVLSYSYMKIVPGMLVFLGVVVVLDDEP